MNDRATRGGSRSNHNTIRSTGSVAGSPPDAVAASGRSGWRDLLNSALDVFGPSSTSGPVSSPELALSVQSPPAGGARAGNSRSGGDSGGAGRAQQKRGRRAGAPLRVDANDHDSGHVMHSALVMSPDAGHEMEEYRGATNQRTSHRHRNTRTNGSWLLTSTRAAEAGFSSGGDDDVDEAEHNQSHEASPQSSSHSRPARRAPPLPPHPAAANATSSAAGSAAETAVPAPVPSPAEHEAQWNEVAARAAQAEQIASVAAAYRRGQLVPCIRENPHELLSPTRVASSVAAATVAAAAAVGLPASPASPSTTSAPENEAGAFGDLVCAECVGDSPCAWARALQAQEKAQLQQLIWHTPLHAAHRADVWTLLLLGTSAVDSPVLAHWERYYAALLASASAPITVSSPRLAAAAARGSPSPSPMPIHLPVPVPSPSPSVSPASVAASGGSAAASAGVPPSSRSPSSHSHSQSRAQFTAIAYGELLKDLDRTFPTFAFFATGSSSRDAAATATGPTTATIGAKTAPAPRSEGLAVLQRLLTAFSLHRPGIGYCQSLNFYAALLCLVCQGRAEAQAFALLCHVLEPRLSMYARPMLGCVLDARVMDSLVSFFEPEVHALLERQGVSVAQFASSWLLCSFMHAPLPLHHALRVWDRSLACSGGSGGSAGGCGGGGGEEVLLHTGLALFHCHRATFLALHRPSSEQLMNIVLRLLGTTTPIDALLARVKATMFEGALVGAGDGTGVGAEARADISGPYAAALGPGSLAAVIASLRRFHRAQLCAEHSVLPMARLRRLERSTSLGTAELQRLWDAFLHGSEDKFATLAAGSISDLVHFRLAFAAAVFGANTSSAGNRTGNDASNAHDAHQRDSRSGQDLSRLWQGAGLVQAALQGSSMHGMQRLGGSNRSSAAASPCSVCVPPLPRASNHLSEEQAAVLRSCPRCTWLAQGEEHASAAVQDALRRDGPDAADLPVHQPSSCSCACTCSSRLPPRALTRSVFGRLFLLFDSRLALNGGFSSSASSFFASTRSVPDPSSSSSAVAVAPRGFVDFESFVAGVKLFTQSERMERIRALFFLAQQEFDDDDDSDEDAGKNGEDTDAHADHPALLGRTRVSRRGFVQLVSLFEELYHGRSLLLPAAPSPPPSASPAGSPVLKGMLPAWQGTAISRTKRQESDDGIASSSSSFPSSSTSPPPPRPLLSSEASARMFVSMAFEKAGVDQARARSIHAPLPRAHNNSSSTGGIEGTAAANAPSFGFPSPVPAHDSDTMDLHSFAQSIQLHPLINSFFRLDSMSD